MIALFAPTHPEFTGPFPPSDKNIVIKKDGVKQIEVAQIYDDVLEKINNRNHTITELESSGTD